MKLLETRNWKIEILLIIAKNDFCSSIFQIMVLKVLKVPRIFATYSLDKLQENFLWTAFSKDASLIKVISSVSYFSQKTFGRKFFWQLSEHV